MLRRSLAWRSTELDLQDLRFTQYAFIRLLWIHRKERRIASLSAESVGENSMCISLRRSIFRRRCCTDCAASVMFSPNRWNRRSGPHACCSRLRSAWIRRTNAPFFRNSFCLPFLTKWPCLVIFSHASGSTKSSAVSSTCSCWTAGSSLRSVREAGVLFWTSGCAVGAGP